MKTPPIDRRFWTRLPGCVERRRSILILGQDADTQSGNRSKDHPGLGRSVHGPCTSKWALARQIANVALLQGPLEAGRPRVLVAAMASTTLRLLPRPLSLAEFGRRARASPCRRGFPGPAARHPECAVATARKARSLMRQNLILAMIYNMFATQNRGNRAGDAADHGGRDDDFRTAMTRKSAHAWRYRCYELLEQGAVGDWASRLVNSIIIGLIVISLIAVALDSGPALATRYHAWFIAVEVVALVAFTIEYGLRLSVGVNAALSVFVAGTSARDLRRQRTCRSSI